MKISTKGRHGVRFLLDIAEQGENKPSTLAAISERQGISLAYLGQIAIILKQSGYIRSIKGSNGGFVLAKPSQEIQLDELLNTLEGSMKVVESPLPSEEETPYRTAIRIGLYQKMDEAVEIVLKKLTLDKLISGKNKPEYMYYI